MVDTNDFLTGLLFGLIIGSLLTVYWTKNHR